MAAQLSQRGDFSMAICITIGQRIGENGASTVRKEERPDAPCIVGDTFTERTNKRIMRGGTYRCFILAAGLQSVFPTDRISQPCTLMPSHPGIATLNPHHYSHIINALDTYHRRHPELEPAFGDDVAWEASVLARLTWLEYWSRIAIVEYRAQAAVENY
jgi:hypothetical protein